MTEEKHQEFHFFVDAVKYTTDRTYLSGLEIKQVAHVQASYQLFLEEQGETPDRAIADSETVPMGHGEHTKHFYAVPPATFGR